MEVEVAPISRLDWSRNAAGLADGTQSTVQHTQIHLRVTHRVAQMHLYPDISGLGHLHTLYTYTLYIVSSVIICTFLETISTFRNYLNIW
jgi:alpha-D-ribose 1-methylphosphonate 5-phosphate C-P lyase